MKDLTIEGKIVIFKSLTISKVVHMALIGCSYFCFRTVEYYKKELYLARKQKNNNKTIYPM